MSAGIAIVVFILALFIIYLVITYNRLVNFRNKLKEQWSQIDVLLKRRNDLIPNLVEIVKSYAKYEKSTLDEVVIARNNCISAKNIGAEMKASSEVSRLLGRLFAVAEAYPDLKANTNFIHLQESLKQTEDKISMARQLYNDTVLAYQNKIEMFPSNMVAKMFGFKREEFFEISDDERKNSEVKF